MQRSTKNRAKAVVGPFVETVGLFVDDEGRQSHDSGGVVLKLEEVVFEPAVKLIEDVDDLGESEVDPGHGVSHEEAFIFQEP